ncbi:MAG: ABC transporter substrate-binding protein [Deltaproteobacteria bacterium]|nr:ABC transporter substrate-binding protein [Deltaproteobacteria bacterium]
MNRTFITNFFGASLIVFLTIASAAAQENKPPRQKLNPEKSPVRAAYVSSSGIYVALWTAVEKGYFKEYGLTVEPVYTRTVSGIQALISGGVQFIHSACPQIMTARKAGADILLLGATLPYNLYVIASRADITEPKQLAGKRVAINQLGDTTHLSVRFALEKAGVNPDRVTYVQVGGTPERLVALESGSVEAALQSAQSLEVIKRLRMNILVNLFERKLPYCGAGMAASDAFTKANPQTTEAFVRGMVKGNAYTREGNPDDVKGIMAKYMKTDAKDQRLIEAYEFYARRAISRSPDIPVQGLAFIIDELSFRDRTWAGWKPEQFYNSAMIEKLEKQGFLEEVYRQFR